MCYFKKANGNCVFVQNMTTYTDWNDKYYLVCVVLLGLKGWIVLIWELWLEILCLSDAYFSVGKIN